MIERTVASIVVTALAATTFSSNAFAFKLKTDAAGIEDRRANLASKWTWTAFARTGVTFAIDNFWNERNHEELTHRTFGCVAEVENRGCAWPTAETKAPLAAIVGVRWNDNPPFVLEDGQSIPGCRGTTIKLPALQPDCWLKIFLDGKKRAATQPDGTPGYEFNSANRSALLLRSHFGDMQFLHAMATKDGETASETKERILSWAEFTYRTAQGDIKPGEFLNQVDVPGFATLFDKQRGWTVTTLLTLGDGTFRVQPAFSWVAFGSLLHVVQDSFARGHVARSDTPNQTCTLSNQQQFDKAGRIRSFHSYANQDDNLHAGADGQQSLAEHLLDPKPGAVEVGAALLEFHNAKAPWLIVREYLDQCVFDLEDPNALSGPGDEFKKPR